jgi:hypothetical protein
MNEIDNVYQLHKSALRGQFCRFHELSTENYSGLGCLVSLDIGIVHKCQYKTIEEAQNGKQRSDGTRGLKCGAFVVRDFGPGPNIRKG